MHAPSDPSALLAANGARPAPAGGIAGFGDPLREWRDAVTAAVVADAGELDVIEFEGPDTAAFLQGQLSNDVTALAPGEGQWTTYNSPKGRMLATLFLARDPASDRHVAWLARDLAAAVAKRLAMFVLRARVAVRHEPGAFRSFGVGGPAAAGAIESALGAAPSPGWIAVHGDLRVAHWPDGRFIVLAPQARAGEVFGTLARHATPAGDPVWAWLGVRTGVPMITLATQDLFVAQGANWDALRGIDFRKGCYTGQEIVARMQYLGRLKERLFAFRAAVPPPVPGTRLYGVSFGDQASGTVVNSAPDPEGGTRFLAVAQIEAANAGPMSIAAPAGPQAQREPLPYEVPAPAPPRSRTGA